MVIHLDTAQAFGVTVPPSLLLRADQTIEYPASATLPSSGLAVVLAAKRVGRQCIRSPSRLKEPARSRSAVDITAEKDVRMWWRQIGEGWAGLKALLTIREPDKKRRIHLVKAKIRRHVEATQARTAGGALFSYDGLVQSGVVEGDELTYTLDALDELVADGILEHVPDQFYALRGRGPFGRVNPP